MEGASSSTVHLPKWTQRQLLEPVELGPGAKLASTVASVLHSCVVMAESRIRRGEIHEHCSPAADVAWPPAERDRQAATPLVPTRAPERPPIVVQLQPEALRQPWPAFRNLLAPSTCRTRAIVSRESVPRTCVLAVSDA